MQSPNALGFVAMREHHYGHPATKPIGDTLPVLVIRRETTASRPFRLESCRIEWFGFASLCHLARIHLAIYTLSIGLDKNGRIEKLQNISKMAMSFSVCLMRFGGFPFLYLLNRMNRRILRDDPAYFATCTEKNSRDSWAWGSNELLSARLIRT
jgi:hypothetical protein